MRYGRLSVLWIAAALVLAGIAAGIIIVGLHGPSPIALRAVSTYNSNGLVAGPSVRTPAMNLGDVAPDRDIWLEISWQFYGEARTLNSVKVGGIPAKRVVRANDVPASANSEIWMVSAGTGDALAAATSAEVAYAFDGGNPSITTQVYRLAGASHMPAATSVGSDSISITIPTKGVALVSLVQPGNASGSLSNVTEDASAQCGKNFHAVHGSIRSASGPVNVALSEGGAAGLAAVALQAAAHR